MALDVDQFGLPTGNVLGGRGQVSFCLFELGGRSFQCFLGRAQRFLRRCQIGLSLILGFLGLSVQSGRVLMGLVTRLRFCLGLSEGLGCGGKGLRSQVEALRRCFNKFGEIIFLGFVLGCGIPSLGKGFLHGAQGVLLLA